MSPSALTKWSTGTPTFAKCQLSFDDRLASPAALGGDYRHATRLTGPQQCSQNCSTGASTKSAWT